MDSDYVRGASPEECSEENNRNEEEHICCDHCHGSCDDGEDNIAIIRDTLLGNDQFTESQIRRALSQTHKAVKKRISGCSECDARFEQQKSGPCKLHKWRCHCGAFFVNRTRLRDHLKAQRIVKSAVPRRFMKGHSLFSNLTLNRYNRTRTGRIDKKIFVDAVTRLSDEVYFQQKTQFCGQKCNKCTGCKCAKAKEPCVSKVNEDGSITGCACGPQCKNAPKEKPGFPLPGWSYEWNEDCEDLLDLDAVLNDKEGALNNHFSENLQDLKPFDVFQTAFWDSKIAEHVISSTDSRTDCPHKFETMENYWKFCLVEIGLGFIKYPTERNVWNLDEDGLFGNEFFRSIMSGKQYEQLRGALRFNVDELQTYLNYKFRSQWDVLCILARKSSSTTYACSTCKVYLHPRCWQSYHELV